MAILRSAPSVVIASDAHGSHRPPALSEAIKELAAYGELQPRRFVEALPRALLARGITAHPQALVA